MSEDLQTLHEEHEEWRKDAWAFLFAFGKHWLWWLGATIGSGSVQLWQSWPRKNGGAVIPEWVLVFIVIFGFIFASFLAFRDQRRIIEKGEQQKQAIEKEAKLLGEKLSEALENKNAAIKQGEDKQKKEKLLCDFLLQLQNRIRTLNGAKRYFEVKDEDRNETNNLIQEIYLKLTEEINDAVAGHFATSKSTTKPLERFEQFCSSYDYEWARHLDFIDAHIDSLKFAIERQLYL
jgi:hypothetical protein